MQAAMHADEEWNEEDDAVQSENAMIMMYVRKVYELRQHIRPWPVELAMKLHTGELESKK